VGLSLKVTFSHRYLYLNPPTLVGGSFKYRLHCCMRHFFCFIEHVGLTVDDISDSTFFEFLDIVSETNKGSMNYILIAIKLISNFLRIERKISIKSDFSKLRLKYPSQRLISPYTEEEIEEFYRSLITLLL